MTDGKLRFYDKGKETLTIDGSSWGKIQTPEMKLEVKEIMNAHSGLVCIPRTIKSIT